MHDRTTFNTASFRKRFTAALLCFLAGGFSAPASSFNEADYRDPRGTMQSKAVAEIVAKARSQNDQCGRFFDWVSRYLIEYDIKPASEMDFKDQAYKFRLAQQSRRKPEDLAASFPFMKLYRREALEKLYGGEFEESRLRKIREEFGEVLRDQCFEPLFGRPAWMGKLGPPLYWLSYFELISFGEHAYAKHNKLVIDQLEVAYKRGEEILTQLGDPEMALDIEGLSRVKVEGEALAKLMWPSDRGKFLDQLSPALKGAQQLAEKNEERGKQEQMFHCARYVAHPDDPGKSDSVTGQTDVQLLKTFDTSLIEDCEVALNRNPSDAQTLFLLGRALMFAGRDGEAHLTLFNAANAGNAAAMAYRAEYEGSLERKRVLLNASLEAGFLPAKEWLAQVNAEIEGYAAYEEELRAVNALEKRLVAEQEKRRQELELECNRLATHPEYPVSPMAVPVSDDDLNVEAAIEACSGAAELNPTSPRLRFQLARALLLSGGLETEAREQLKVAADLGDPIATFLLFQRAADPKEAMDYLKASVFADFEPAKLILERIPKPPKRLATDMIYQDVSAIDRFFEMTEPAEMTAVRAVDCKRQFRGMPPFALKAPMEDLYVAMNDRSMPFGYLNGKTTEQLRAMANSWCENMTEDIYGGCVDLYLTDFNGDAFDVMDQGLRVTLAMANTLEVRADEEYFDTNVGPLTDYIGYFYARQLGIVSPFDDAVFDDSYMFTGDTDPYVQELVRSLVQKHKLYVVTGATDSKYLCR